MTQLVRADPDKTGAQPGVVGDLAHPGAAQRAMRSPDSHEHAASDRALRATRPEIGDDRLADIDQQRQPVRPGVLAMHDDLSSAPVDVIKRQSRHLADPQPETGQEHQHREITATNHLRAITGPKQLVDLLGFQTLGQ